ncbi:hypothetical protein ACMSI6_17155 [Pseudomonas antarctica]|uniref:hypothetical protein n=1 Tax=Pseudomonas antarctica TaxID=219572 RepID=UPI0039C4283E
MNMSRRWSDLNQAMTAYKPSGTGISLSVRKLYSCVQQSSIDCSFDADQVKIIWRTASEAYSVFEISRAFESLLKEVQSTSIFNASYLVDTLPLPLDVLEGPGSVATRTLARLRAQHDAEPVWVLDTGVPVFCFSLNRPEAPWVNFTYALLDTLVKDELLKNSFRCKLFARDLGL